MSTPVNPFAEATFSTPAVQQTPPPQTDEPPPTPVEGLKLQTIRYELSVNVNIGQYSSIRPALACTFSVPEGMSPEQAAHQAVVVVRDALLREHAQLADEFGYAFSQVIGIGR